MKRAAVRNRTISGVVVSLALAVWTGGDMWLNPHLAAYSSDELRVEARALVGHFTRQPWYIAWAPALRHKAVWEEMRRRGGVGLRG